MSTPDGDSPRSWQLVFGQLAQKKIKRFLGSEQDFESWLRSFEDIVRMVNSSLLEQLKTNTLVGILEGEARELVGEMPYQDKNSYVKIVDYYDFISSPNVFTVQLGNYYLTVSGHSLNLLVILSKELKS